MVTEKADPTVWKMILDAYEGLSHKSMRDILTVEEDGTHVCELAQHLDNGVTKRYTLRITVEEDSRDDYYSALELDSNSVVIHHVIYTIGKEPSNRQESSGLGMAGRQFTIDHFDGRTTVTHNLWAGSTVPPKWREKFPNTADFRYGGAVQVGETRCWNADPLDLQGMWDESDFLGGD